MKLKRQLNKKLEEHHRNIEYYREREGKSRNRFMRKLYSHVGNMTSVWPCDAAVANNNEEYLEGPLEEDDEENQEQNEVI